MRRGSNRAGASRPLAQLARLFFDMKRLLSLVLVLCGLVGLAWPQAGAAPRTIQPGDKLRIVCEEEPSISKDYTVKEDGTITVTFLGTIRVQGQTADQLAQFVAKKLEDDRIVRRATVRVTIIGEVSGRVSFGGAVRSTGDAPLTAGMRLADVLKLANPLPDADLTRVQLRSAEGTLNVIDFTKFDPQTNAANPVLRPGDTVVFVLKVQGETITILGGVMRPGVMEWKRDMTVAGAVQLAGGLSPLARGSRVRLRRGTTERTIDLGNPTQASTVLQPGDQVLVDISEGRRYVRVGGGVQVPGLVEFTPGLTLMAAVQNRGGVVPKAQLNKVEIQTVDLEKRTVDLGPILAGYAADITLQAGDVVNIPGGERRRSGGSLQQIGIAVIGILLFFLGG